MNSHDVVAALAALAQESRLAVYRLLVKRGPDGFAAGEISAQLGIPGPTLSFHLKELTQTGLVTARKESRYIYYAASFERMNGLLAYLTENCCGMGIGCAPACAPGSTSTSRSRSA
ncbi:MAG: metalloregulator ArsR/SmtB family transcription factor [Steroidobacteraceae bacterium]|nr:metalloregulator ArsR/SmtB family transcription factor [Steroidobacteraceae bacterium]